MLSFEGGFIFLQQNARQIQREVRNLAREKENSAARANSLIGRMQAFK
jgi:hypothetical protein